MRRGRSEFLHQFPSLAAEETQDYLALPHDVQTFLRCQLNFAERKMHHAAYALHCDLLQLRREDLIFSGPGRQHLDGAVLSSTAFVLRFFAKDETGDRLLIINCGRDLLLSPLPEPLLAPHVNCDWRILGSSEHPRYGGGTAEVHTDNRWALPGYSALVFVPDDRGDKHHV